MQYQGGKARQAKHIAPHIVRYIDYKFRYVEPFVGSGSVTSEVCKLRPQTEVLASDANAYVIALHQRLQQGYQPPSIVSRELYEDIRYNKEAYEPELVGFVGHGLSYGGKWFGGYASGSVRNYAQTARNRLFKLHATMHNVQFHCQSYSDLSIPYRAVIYCDPPYAGTTGYAGTNDFDSDKFWRWCAEITLTRDSVVLVSEYEGAPPPWLAYEVLSAWPRRQTLNRKSQKRKKSKEVLYLVRGINILGGLQCE